MASQMRIFVVVLITLLLVASCANQPTPNSVDSPGFFTGLFHGFIIVFSLITSLFTDIRIYAFPNSGG